MNLLGECLWFLMDYYDVDNGDLIVIYDDFDFLIGKICLRIKGSVGGYNGIKLLIQYFGIFEFDCICIGIGWFVNGMKVVDYVLGFFNKEEVFDIDGVIDKFVKVCEVFLSKLFLEVMNEFNVKV